MAVVSTGVKLSFDIANGVDFVELTNLQEVPELGGERDSLEITVLADDAHMYTDGILNYGESVPFKFLYEKAQFMQLAGLTAVAKWKVELPDKTSFTFSGKGSAKLDAVAPNQPLTYTLSVKPCTKIEIA